MPLPSFMKADPVVAGFKSLGDNRSSSIVVKVVKAVSGVRSDSRKRMSRRSGQAGYVVTKGDMFHGRYWADVPGQEKRVRKSLLIGPMDKMTKPEAKRKLRAMLEEIGINTAAHLDRAINPGKTFQQKVTQWEETDLIMCKPSSANIPYVVKKHLIPPFGSLPLDMVTEDRVKEWMASLVRQGKLAPKSIHNVWKILRMILGKRHTLGWTIKLPGIPKNEQRYFTPEEAKQIVDAAEGQYKTLFALQFATGMRIGEICGLHVEDIDMKEAIVHIRRGTFRLQETSPKTDAGYRDVDVNPAMIQVLKEYIGDRVTGRLFHTKNGTPLVLNNINRHVLKPICKKLGIRMGTTHAFRHGRVSFLQKKRVPGDLIKEWVGHTSLKVTSRYTHFSDEDRKEEIARLDPMDPTGNS